MAKDMDSLLRFVADYHAFCDPTDNAALKTDGCQDELSVEELEFVAAAAQNPPHGPDPDRTR